MPVGVLNVVHPSRTNGFFSVMAMCPCVLLVRKKIPRRISRLRSSKTSSFPLKRKSRLYTPWRPYRRLIAACHRHSSEPESRRHGVGRLESSISLVYGRDNQSLLVRKTKLNGKLACHQIRIFLITNAGTVNRNRPAVNAITGNDLT
jgi:hypothetical protein